MQHFRFFGPYDLWSVLVGKTAADVLAATVELARWAERWGFLRSSQLLDFSRLRTGDPGKLPERTGDLSEIPTQIRAEVEAALCCSSIGSEETGMTWLRDLLATFRPDEIIVTGMIHDHKARLRSFEIAAKVLGELCQEPLSNGWGPKKTTQPALSRLSTQ